MRARSLIGLLICVAVTMSVLLLVSCSSPRPPASSGTSTKEAKPYGSLKVAADFGEGVLDPRDQGAQAYRGIGQSFVDSLVFRDPDGQLKPGLAERWEISGDGMAHTFYIRRGVKFHDGSDLTGADVKFSLEWMYAPQSIASSAAIWRAAIASVELKDDYVVVIRMKTPQFEELRLIDSNMGAVLPKKYIEEKGIDYWNKNPIGSGPFKIVSYERGARLELEALESHWREVPKFKNVTVLSVPEEGTRIAMVKTGELDVAKVSPDSAPGLKAAGMRITSWAEGQMYLGWPFYDVDNPERYALGDVRVRKALTLSMNRQEVIDKIYHGYAKPSVVHVVSPKSTFFDPNVMKLDPYDPDQAKKLLAEAGYPDGFNTKIWDTVGRGVLATFNLALAGYWQRIGIKAVLQPIQYPAFSPMMTPKQKPEIWNSIWTYDGQGNLDFAGVIRVYHSTKGVPKNLKNPKLDALLDKVPMTRDPAERNRLAIEAVVVAKNEYSALPLLDVDTVLALGPKVGQVTPFVATADITAIQFATVGHSN